MTTNGIKTKMVTLGDASLSGWRRKVASPVADKVSERTGLTPEQIRAIIGFAFLALSVYSLIKRARRAAVQA